MRSIQCSGRIRVAAITCGADQAELEGAPQPSLVPRSCSPNRGSKRGYRFFVRDFEQAWPLKRKKVAVAVRVDLHDQLFRDRMFAAHDWTSCWQVSLLKYQLIGQRY